MIYIPLGNERQSCEQTFQSTADQCRYATTQRPRLQGRPLQCQNQSPMSDRIQRRSLGGEVSRLADDTNGRRVFQPCTQVAPRRRYTKPETKWHKKRLLQSWNTCRQNSYRVFIRHCLFICLTNSVGWGAFESSLTWPCRRGRDRLRLPSFQGW